MSEEKFSSKHWVYLSLGSVSVHYSRKLPEYAYESRGYRRNKDKLSIQQQQKEKPTQRQTFKQAHRYTDIKTKKHTEKQIVRQTDTRTRNHLRDGSKKKKYL